MSERTTVYDMADDKLTAITNLIQSGKQVLPADEILGKITAIIDPPPANADRANPVHCALCLNRSGSRVPATQVIDGYSLCEDDAQDVIDLADWVYRDVHNRFDLRATVAAMRKRRAAV